MKHAREDYKRIQDPLKLIGEDEPVFLLRAKDMSAPKIVRMWAQEQIDPAGNTENELRAINSAFKHADFMEEWQLKNGSKPADLTIIQSGGISQ